jgi:hypothetical protein
MRKSFLPLMVSAMLTMGVCAAAATAGKVPDGETVGGFALKVAAAYGADAKDQTAAVTALKALGVYFEQDVSARLTEKQAVRILADLGLAVVPPASPDKPVSVAMANLLATRVGLTCAKGSTPPPNGMPTQCLSSKNRGACVECCKEATRCGTHGDDHHGDDHHGKDHGHDDHGGGFDCEVCAHFCKANVPPPPSPGKP